MERLSPVIGLQERVRGYWLTGVPDFNNLTVWEHGADTHRLRNMLVIRMDGDQAARSIELYPFGSCTYCIHIGPASDPYREENVVALDKHEDDRIWQITMNRPHRLNAIGGGLGSALTEAWEAFRDDPNARVAILTGAGRAFSAGADLRQTAEIREKVAAGGPPPSTAPQRSWIPLAESLNLWKPTIAAINGYAIAGGFMMAMQCDIRIMAQSARVGIAEVRWNMGGAGWMAPLTRQMGLGHALELCVWGDEQWDADKCFRTGWANAVVPDDQLMETAMAWARRVLDLAPRSQRNIKEALYRGPYMNPLEAQRYGGHLEQNLQGMQDSIEGPKAFAERRTPHFIDA